VEWTFTLYMGNKKYTCILGGKSSGNLPLRRQTEVGRLYGNKTDHAEIQGCDWTEVTQDHIHLKDLVLKVLNFQVSLKCILISIYPAPIVHTEQHVTN